MISHASPEDIMQSSRAVSFHSQAAHVQHNGQKVLTHLSCFLTQWNRICSKPKLSGMSAPLRPNSSAVNMKKSKFPRAHMSLASKSTGRSRW